MTSFVPHSRQAVAEPQSGLMTPPWYAWAQRIDDAVIAGAYTREQAEAAVRQIATALGSPDGTIENIPPLSGGLIGAGSVVTEGGFARLRNDQEMPPPTSYYGTDAEGIKAFHAISGTLIEGDGAALGVDDTGRVTVYGLDPLAVYLTDEAGSLLTDSDGSPLLAEGPSTTRLPEGSNLYFTAQRAQDAVPPLIDGREYLSAFHDRLRAGLSASMLFSGDSTTAGNSLSDPARFRIDNAVLRVGRTLRHVLTATSSGHSGAHTGDWVSTYLAADLATNPGVMVLRWGLNDPFWGRDLADFEASLRAGLTTLRAAKSVAQMSVVLMTPSTANDTPNGRDAEWLEAVRPIVRRAARDFLCVFVDTYALWRDAEHAAGVWMDNPFGDGRSIHPLDTMNAWIASKLSELLFPAALTPRRSSVLATKAADQTYTIPGFSTIVYDVEGEDARGEYDPTTGTFTAQQAGKYLLTAGVYFGANTENRVLIVSAMVNGSEAVRLDEVTSLGSMLAGGGLAGNSAIVTLAAGDALRIATYVSSPGPTYEIKNFAFATFLKIIRMDDQ